jgi:hypothetical protein
LFNFVPSKNVIEPVLNVVLFVPPEAIGNALVRFKLPIVAEVTFAVIILVLVIFAVVILELVIFAVTEFKLEYKVAVLAEVNRLFAIVFAFVIDAASISANK